MARTPTRGLAPLPEEITGPTMERTRLAVQFADTLRSEAKLLSELSATMQRQREAVAVDDLDGIDASVFATHRVLSTLAEARRRRRSLAQLLGGTDDLSLSGIVPLFRDRPPAHVAAATDELSEAARTLQREVEMNRRVLRRAVQASEASVRALCGMPPAAPAGYPNAPGTNDHASGGNIVDRRM